MQTSASKQSADHPISPLSRLNFDDSSHSMCLEHDFKGTREKSAKNMTRKGLI
ncbi:hypothetical protein RHMOL_Rhmol02G0187600 [Rhododendron molle]|uniref:Uncharacterized protein n=1 Tax=Rhododendron molle TaxID=49168 RepID=A0ACC0PRS6_RHOML|nr:hypothetical protein RHMOL_Rhmol02G0187600 [Rhododendron molle]